MNACHRIVAVALVAAILPSGAWSARSTDLDAGGTVQIVDAVWKVQSLDFAYRGYSTYYSCSTLRERLQTILRGVGAHDTLTIRMRGCSDLASSTRVQIILASPVEATPENVRALTSYDSEDVLVARVRSERLDTAEDIQRFPATWKTISLSRDRKLDLGPSDCELVRQLRQEVFPRLSIRIVYDNLRCSAAFPNIGQPQLSIAALVAITDRR